MPKFSVYTPAMAINRWEWLEGLKPQSIISVAVKTMAEIIAEELSNWPPEVIAKSDVQRPEYLAVLKPTALRPPLAAFEEAIKRARWELQRDFEAIDYYERNHKLAQLLPNSEHRAASELIQHYILESFFTLMERTEYRIKRKDVISGLDWLQEYFRAGSANHSS
jgi:hypothetical protein